MVFPLLASDMRPDMLLFGQLKGIAWLLDVDEDVFHLDVLLPSKFSRQPNT